MRSLKWVTLMFVFSLFFGTGILYAEETKTPEPAKAPEAATPEAKAPEAAAAPAAAAPEEKVTGSASVAFLNRYIFRGYEIGKSGLVVQPSLSASFKGFSATLWGNVDSNQRNTTSATFSNEGHKGWDETDLILSYTYPIGKLSITGGYIYYDLKYAQETEEFFLTFAYDMITKPTFSVYQDVNSYLGTYFNLSFAHSIPLPKDITLDLAASFGYEWGQSNYWQTWNSITPTTGAYTGSKYSAFHDGMVKAGLTIPLTKAFVAQPMVQYYFPLSSDASRTEGFDPITGMKIAYNPNGYVPGNFVYGVNFTYSF